MAYKVGQLRLLWWIGSLYALGLLWLLPIQPLRFTDWLQSAVELSIMVGLPLLLLSMGYRITGRARRITFRIVMSVILLVTLPWSCTSCLDYVIKMQTERDGSEDKGLGLYTQNIAVLHTKYGLVKAVVYAGFMNDVPDIRVYLDRPVIPGVVHRVLLVAMDSINSANEAEIHPRGPDSVEINIPHWSAHGSDVHLVRRISP